MRWQLQLLHFPASVFCSDKSCINPRVKLSKQLFSTWKLQTAAPEVRTFENAFGKKSTQMAKEAPLSTHNWNKNQTNGIEVRVNKAGHGKVHWHQYYPPITMPLCKVKCHIHGHPCALEGKPKYACRVRLIIKWMEVGGGDKKNRQIQDCISVVGKL